MPPQTDVPRQPGTFFPLGLLSDLECSGACCTTNHLNLVIQSHHSSLMLFLWVENWETGGLSPSFHCVQVTWGYMEASSLLLGLDWGDSKIDIWSNEVWVT